MGEGFILQNHRAAHFTWRLWGVRKTSKTEMAAKGFFLFVAVLVLFEAEAALYRRVFDGPGSPFMRGK